MRAAALALFLTLVAAAAPAQQTVEVPAIRDTIGAQIEAFRADDFATAFTFASPAIRGIFGTAENFGTMVRNGYPMVWRPAGVQYFDQAQQGAAVWQRMIFTDQAGTEHWFAYEMVQVGGEWRVNGVFPIDAPDLGV